MTHTDILHRLEDRLLKAYDDNRNARLLYHNYAFATGVSDLVLSIGEKAGLATEAIRAAQMAVYLYALGFTEQYNEPDKAAAAYAASFLETMALPEKERTAVIQCLETFLTDKNTPENRLLSDAVQAYDYGLHFLQLNGILKLEKELCANEKLTADQWHQWLIQQLVSVRFSTPYARLQFEPVVAQNLLRIKEKLEKSQLKSSFSGLPNGDRFRDLPGRNPGRIIQTFYRTNFNNHIHLSAIADNKAHIMISVNAILTSVVISIITYRNITQTNPMIMMPVVIFLITSMASLIFAVLSARPKVTMLNKKPVHLASAKKNLIYFGNFVNLDADQYEEAMNDLFHNPPELYANLTRDLYYLGKVLERKYFFLSFSYNIFMLGFIATVVTFMAAMWL